MARGSKKENQEKKVTRYTYEDIKEPRTPETGHTALLPTEEQVVTLPMDNGWSKAIHVGKLPEGDERPVVLDMDPATDPVLFWAGKRNRREVPVLPLQRNEIVSDSRISQIIDRARKAAEKGTKTRQAHLFANIEKDLRDIDRSKRVEFYTHEEGWKNKLICGDSLQVMESLIHYENMPGKVQMIYIDPPYGIDYDSNFQQRVDSMTNDQKDLADDVVTIKAFNDTWALGVHSYLTYLSERFYLCRELLGEKGSIFVQISDQNVHLVRALLDEVFGYQNFVALVPFRKKTMPMGTLYLEQMSDFLIWYAKSKFDSSGRPMAKYYTIHSLKDVQGEFHWCWFEMPDGSRHQMSPEQNMNHNLLPPRARVYRLQPMEPSGPMESGRYTYEFEGQRFPPPKNGYSVPKEGMDVLNQAGRLQVEGTRLRFVTYLDETRTSPITAPWNDTIGADDKRYVVQTNSQVISRCIAMTTDPGDLVIDPTCGGGTTAIAAERMGRRWITIDTSRVAMNVTRQRLLSSLFPHFTLKGKSPSDGFNYVEETRVTIGSVANNQEPQKIELRLEPKVDSSAIRVCGPFEVMSVGRYSVEDWKGYVVQDPGLGEVAKLENYIEVICRLYRKDAAIQGATGLVHAVAETEKQMIAISVGPLSGRVTGKQINDAVQDALATGILHVHVLGWAFEANVGEVKSQLEKRGKVKVELIMIRPDTLAEGLKASQPEMLFSPLALPDIDVVIVKNSTTTPEIRVTLTGVAMFDRKRHTTDYKSADSGYISAWYLDEDYDGDCFVDCQMFFDFKKIPNIKAAVEEDVDPEEFKLKLESEMFSLGEYKRIAVKVVDVYGNESTVVKDIV